MPVDLWIKHILKQTNQNEKIQKRAKVNAIDLTMKVLFTSGSSYLCCHVSIYIVLVRVVSHLLTIMELDGTWIDSKCKKNQTLQKCLLQEVMTHIHE